MFVPSYYRDRLKSLPQVAVDASDYQIINTTSRFKSRLLELIQVACRRIYITTLYLEADNAGEEVLRALFEAKQANPELDIQIFVDFHRSQRGRIGEAAVSTNRDFYKRVSRDYQHSITIHGVPVKNREVFGVLHLKGFIFDDTLFYSGASLNDVYLHHANRYRFDRYHEIHSQTLSDSFVDFINRYFVNSAAVKPLNVDAVYDRKRMKPEIRRFRRIMRSATYSLNADYIGDKIGMSPVSGLGSRGNHLNTLIRNLVRSTEQELFVCTPYFNLPRSLARDINQLLRRNVKITIVIGDKTANDFYIAPDQPFSRIGALPYLYEHNLRAFARRHQKDIGSGLLNLMLWKDEDHSYHLKGLFADDNMALITGSNLNPRAWGLDLENGILIQDPQQLMQEDFRKEQNHILNKTTRIDSYRQLEKLSDYPEKVQKLLSRIHKLKAHMLIKKII